MRELKKFLKKMGDSWLKPLIKTYLKIRNVFARQFNKLYKRMNNVNKEKSFEKWLNQEYEIYKGVAKETSKLEEENIGKIFEYLDNCIDLFNLYKHYQDDEITNSISAIFLYNSMRQLRWIIHEILSGSYFEAVRDLRFTFETIVWAHLLDELIDKKTREQLKVSVGAGMSLKYEILKLKDEIYDIGGYRKKKDKREIIIKQKVGWFIEQHALNFTKKEKENYKKLYFEILEQLGFSFSGTRLIAELPLDEQDKKKLKKIYSKLSKYIHPSHKIIEPFYEDDSSLIFNFEFNKKLFDECFIFCINVMDLFYTILYIHFEKLREIIKKKIVDFCKTKFNMEFPITEKLINKNIY